MWSSESIDTEVALGIVWLQNLNILKLKYFTGTVGLMQSTTTTQNNLFEHKRDRLAFKLLMLIIVKQLFILISNWLLFSLYSSWLQPPVTEIKTQKRKHLCLDAKWSVWDQNVMLQINVWKEYFNHVSLLLCIYIYKPNPYI